MNSVWLPAALLLLLPFAVWQRLPYPHYIGGTLLQCLSLAAVVVWSWPRTRQLRRATWTEAALAGYVLLCAAGWFYAPSPRLSLIGCVAIFFPALWGLMLGRLLSQSQRRMIFRLICASGSLAAVNGIYHFMRYKHLDGLEMALGHRNLLAIFLLPAMLLPTLDLLRRQLEPVATEGPLNVPWPIALITVVLCFGVMLMCGSIGAFLGLAAGLWMLFFLRLKPGGRWILTAVTLACAVGGIVALSLPQVEAITAAKPQFQRWYLWKGAVRMMLEHPVFGWGAGMFPLYFSDFKPTAPMQHGILMSFTWHPHNELLLVGVEVGLVGLLLYLAFLGGAAGRLIRLIDHAPDPTTRLARKSLLVIFVAMFTHGLVTIGLRWWAPGALYWTILGMMLAEGRAPAQGTKETNRSARTLLFGLLIMTAGFLIWTVVWPGLRAERLWGNALRATGLPPAERAELFGQVVENSRYIPDQLLAREDRAESLVQAKDLDGAIEVSEDLHSVAPGFEPSRELLARNLTQRASVDDLARAIELLHAAVKQNPYRAKSRLLLAQALYRTGPRNLTLAIEQARAAVAAHPKDEHAREVLEWLEAQLPQ